MVVKEINTHKAVRDGNVINIYVKGLDPKALDLNGNPIWTEADIRRWSKWFQDELIYTIPVENKDNLFAMFERFEETNRIDVAELNAALA